MNQDEMLLLQNIKILAPSNVEDLVVFTESYRKYLAEPFDERRINALNNLSKLILQDHYLRSNPASVAVAFWLRRSNLLKIRDRFERKQELEGTQGILFVPAGYIFHIAPANVDTMFLYSWALAFLCGNVNVVRITTQRSEVVQRLLECINQTMAGHEQLSLCNRFVTYEHDRQLTELLSAFASHRVVWGGDETVNSIRQMRLNPHASERTFSSKFSYSILSAAHYLDTTETNKQLLASRFFNDVFWFDQMACSSPHLIFWIGDSNDIVQATPEFDIRLETEIQNRQYEASISNSVRRINFAFGMAADKNVRVNLGYRGFTSLNLADKDQIAREICGGGLFTHVHLDNMEQLAEFASEKDQTITHFGFERSELVSIAKRLGKLGVDRLVPVGSALEFTWNWDGYDLIRDFLRGVTIQL